MPTCCNLSKHWESEPKLNLFDSIIVTPSKTGKGLDIHNPTSLPLLGKGAQGAVFSLPEGKCVKIYWDTMNVMWESKALRAGKDSPIFPKLFQVGTNFVVMEEIEGPTLQAVIKKLGHMPEGMISQIIAVLRTMKSLKFKRIDTRLSHLIVTKDGSLKVIDHIGAFQQDRKIPTNLLKSLRDVKLAHHFMDEVCRIDPDLYNEWLELM